MSSLSVHFGGEDKRGGLLAPVLVCRATMDGTET